MLAAVLPLLALSIGMAWQNVRVAREAEADEMRRLAVAAGSVVEAHIARATLLLEALSRSPALQTGNIVEFDRHLRAVAAATDVVIILANRDGIQVLNSNVPRGGEPPDRPGPGVMERVLRVGKPNLSNAIVGPLPHRIVAGLMVPVPNGTADAAVVAARLDPLQLAPILPRPERWHGAFVVVYDGNGQQFSSTAPADIALPPLPDQPGGGDTETTWPGLSALGFTAAIEPVRGTTWRVAVVAPKEAISATSLAIMNWLIAAGTLVIALSAVFAVILGRFLVREAGTLLADAGMAVAGSVPPEVKSAVHEFDVLRGNLQTMATATRQAIIAEVRLAGLTQTAAQLESRVAQRTRELEETTGRLLNAQDNERRRIARELHDSTVQELIAASLHLRAVQITADGRSEWELNEARQALDRVKEELRTLAFVMQPPLLDECGIATALSVYAEGFGRRSGLEIKIIAPTEDPVLPRAVETVLFRVAQEALTNVHRHAGCTSCRIRLEVMPSEALLEIEDEGRGMAAGKHAAVGVGIIGMRARVRQLGGKFAIASDANGTRLRVTIALAVPAIAAAISPSPSFLATPLSTSVK